MAHCTRRRPSWPYVLIYAVFGFCVAADDSLDVRDAPSLKINPQYSSLMSIDEEKAFTNVNNSFLSLLAPSPPLTLLNADTACDLAAGCPEPKVQTDQLNSNIKLLLNDSEDKKESGVVLVSGTLQNDTGDTRDLRDTNSIYPGIRQLIEHTFPLFNSIRNFPRDPQNPLNFLSFLSEGAEWLITPTADFVDDLGESLAKFVKGITLKTAGSLPNYRRNVIISYRDFKPTMWIDMLANRNQFLRQMAAMVISPYQVKSIYLRNLGMEIFELPDGGLLRQFVSSALNLDAFVSDAYVDDVFNDFDPEITKPENADINLPSYTPTDTGPRSVDDHMHTYKSTAQDASARTHSQPPFIDQSHRDHVGVSTSPRRLDIIPNDPFTWQQWAIIDSGPHRWGIEAPRAWDIWSGQNVTERLVVAVIDSGVDYRHPDLQRQIWRNPLEICGNGIDDDVNGLVDDCIGWDFIDGDNDPMDENGHGTASAGIIAAEANNGIGVTGVCWGCEIMILKALDKDIKGTVSTFARAIDYAIGKGVKLSNNSYGGRGSGFKGLEAAVRRARQAGMVFVAAAGNYNGNNDNDAEPVYPASYDLSNILSVAAISRNGQLAPFSSYGKRQVDIAAPGTQIMSTALNNTYKAVDGTSFAVPLVTGIAALLWTREAHLTYTQIIDRLLRSAKFNNQLTGMTATSGTVDAFAALSLISSPIPPASQICTQTSCSPYAACTNTPGGPSCACRNGFQGDGIVCKDIDECAFSPCGPASICLNIIGSYECKCRQGFEQQRNTCVDVDECQRGASGLGPRPCPLAALCVNFSGAYDCVCPEGFAWNAMHGDSAQCLKINSPATGPCAHNGGCGVNSLCQAPSLGWAFQPTCTCLTGYQPYSAPPSVPTPSPSPTHLFLQTQGRGPYSPDASVQRHSPMCLRQGVLLEELNRYLLVMNDTRRRSLKHTESLNTLAQTNFNPRIPTPAQVNAPSHISRQDIPTPAQPFPTHMEPILTNTNPSTHAAPDTPINPNAQTAEIDDAARINNHVSKISTWGPLFIRPQSTGVGARSNCVLGICFA